MTKKAGPKVYYHAISIINSKTFWANVIAVFVAAGPDVVAYLTSSEVKVLVPDRYMGLYGIGLAVLNIFLRMKTVRPAALIAPGTTQPVAVQRIGPPAPPAMSD